MKDEFYEKIIMMNSILILICMLTFMINENVMNQNNKIR